MHHSNTPSKHYSLDNTMLAGINVSLQSFIGVSDEYLQRFSDKSGENIYVNIKKRKVWISIALDFPRTLIFTCPLSSACQ